LLEKLDSEPLNDNDRFIKKRK